MDSFGRFLAGEGHDLMSDFINIILDALWGEMTIVGGQERKQEG